ncbi:hypothetical protein [Alicyclobacillus fodiniaquatilis]|uniref:DUF1453 domain-containing protein n=1 Tax=Alicyclobacillus fodiniaquatilis TaxID=1661150 RepID=A0ABW4JEU1_9BACL
MSLVELVAILALVAYAIWKQTQVSEVRSKGRFKLAIIYGIVGIVVGGISSPHGTAAMTMFILSVLLSLVIGVARGFLTRVWVEANERIFRKGTALTVGLFVALIVAKFALGTVAYLQHIQDDASFGEIMIMMAIMVAVQAEIVWRRGNALMNPAVRSTPKM